MSRKLFTEEQIAALRQNPYVYSVSRSTLVLRKSFKEIFYTEYMEGVYPKDIFKKYGFDPAVLGERRIGGALQHIKEEYAKYGCFYEGRRPAGRSDTAAKVKPEDDIKALRHEVEYLRQEMEYLKKIPRSRTQKGRFSAHERFLLCVRNHRKDGKYQREQTFQQQFMQDGRRVPKRSLCLGEGGSISAGPGRTGPQGL